MCDSHISKEMENVFNNVLKTCNDGSVTLRSIKRHMIGQSYPRDVIEKFIYHLKTSTSYIIDKRGNDYVLCGFVNNTNRIKVVVRNFLTPKPRVIKKVKKVKNDDVLFEVTNNNVETKCDKKVIISTKTIVDVDKIKSVPNINLDPLPGLEYFEKIQKERSQMDIKPMTREEKIEAKRQKMSLL